jgi:N-hydroxyarylamine O-acetyltransferase
MVTTDPCAYIPPMLDLDAYLARIGLSGRPSLAEVHRAHVLAIPFENLDPHRGARVSLEPDALERKLVGERRGGYCFEQNLLFAEVLRALGAEVELLLARVRAGAPPGTIRPRTHLVLRVAIEGTSWLADVGFGNGTPLEPIPFAVGGVHEQSGWRIRLIQEKPLLVLQAADGDGWSDVYAFSTEPVPLIDVHTSNWFTATHPDSMFVKGLLVTANAADGTRVTLSDWSGELTLVERRPDSTTTTAISRDAIPTLLSERFGLGGFALDADGRVTQALDR